jgi:hypothetical protein
MRPSPRSIALIIAFASGVAVADTSIGAATPTVDAATLARARSLWTELPRTTERCGEFDYFPDGGMRNFYCHLLSRIRWVEFCKLVPMKIFLSGPHRDDALVLDARRSFGHYNPAFVKWLGAAFLPAAQDPKFRAATQAIYDAKVRPLARAFHAAHQALAKHRDVFEKEQKLLLKQLANGGTPEAPYEKFYRLTDDQYDGNVTKTAVAFWIRRGVDGTEREFFADLKLLLQTYDKEFLKESGAPAPSVGD